MTLYTLLVLGHVIGSVGGVTFATLAEVMYARLSRTHEASTHAYQKTHRLFTFVYTLLRVSTLMTLLTGIGFVCYFAYSGDNAYIYSAMFWAKMAMLACIGITTYLLHTRRISYYFGSALSLTSWWLVFAVSFFLKNETSVVYGYPRVSFLVTIALYGAAVVVCAALLHTLRKKRGLQSAVLAPHV